MGTYVVGDVQGCFITLARLLERIDFVPSRDRLWFAGDLVNRGPDSVKVLRFVRGLGGGAVTVQGNHDRHLIARMRGLREKKRRDTMEDVLRAPDGEELVNWLAAQPFLHRDGDFVMVHAGLLPCWSLDEAEALARKAAKKSKQDKLTKPLQRAIDAFTRLRTVTDSGEMCLDFAGPPEDAPPGCRPWFELAQIPDHVTVLFGHWASLGLHLGQNAIGLDSGCVWGGALTAVRLEDRRVFQQPSELNG